MSTRVTLAIVNGGLRLMLALVMSLCIANKFVVEYRSDQADNRGLYAILCMGFLAVIYAIEAATLPAAEPKIVSRTPARLVAAKPEPPPVPTGPLTRPVGRVPDDRINIDEWDVSVVDGKRLRK